MRRVAALDCGTNSIRLLIAEENPGASTFTEISRKMSIVKLGEGVDKNKVFLPDAISRTLAALKIFAATGVVIPSCTEALMSVGILDVSIASRAASVALLQPPPIKANTFC